MGCLSTMFLKKLPPNVGISNRRPYLVEKESSEFVLFNPSDKSVRHKNMMKRQLRNSEDGCINELLYMETILPNPLDQLWFASIFFQLWEPLDFGILKVERVYEPQYFEGN